MDPRANTASYGSHKAYGPVHKQLEQRFFMRKGGRFSYEDPN